MPTKKVVKKFSKKNLIKRAFKKVVSSPKKPVLKTLRNVAFLGKPASEIEHKTDQPGDRILIIAGGIPVPPQPVPGVRKMSLPPLPEYAIRALGTEQASEIIRRSQNAVNNLLSAGVKPQDIQVVVPLTSDETKRIEAAQAASTAADEALAAAAALSAVAKKTTEVAAAEAAKTLNAIPDNAYTRAVLQLAKQYDNSGNYGGTFVDRIKEALAIEMAVMPTDMREMVEELFGLL